MSVTIASSAGWPTWIVSGKAMRFESTPYGIVGSSSTFAPSAWAASQHRSAIISTWSASEPYGTCSPCGSVAPMGSTATSKSRSRAMRWVIS